MSTINSANVQVGQNVTASKNITFNTDADGNLIINKGVYPTLTEIGKIYNNGGNTTEVNVQQFGAVGDGVTDDTAALLAWLAALGSGNFETSISGARIGNLAPGKYKYTTTLNIPANTTIVGAFNNSTLQPTSAVSVAVTMEGGATMQGVVVDGLNTTNCIGVQLGAAALVSNITLRDVTIARFDGTNDIGLDVQETVIANYDNCYFTDNYVGVKIYHNSANSTPTAQRFANCTIKSNDTRGVWIKSGTSLSFDTCVLELNGTEGAYINQESDVVENVVFNKCYFEANQYSLTSGATRHAEYQFFGRGKNLAIRDCYFFGNTNEARAIELENAIDYVVDHCTIYSETNQILTSGTSVGTFVSWPDSNGSIDTRINNTSSNEANPSLLYNQYGTWTPEFTCATVGNLSIAYSQQVGRYERRGRFIKVLYNLQFIPTHTTASGAIRITGLPFTAKTGIESAVGTLVFQGVTKAGYTQIVSRVVSATSRVDFVCAGTTLPLASLEITDMPSTGTVFLFGEIEYEVS